MPRLTEEQQRLILALSYPLPSHQRSEFYERIAAEIASLPEVGDGTLYRLAAGIQRSMVDYPLLNHIGGASSKDTRQFNRSD
jgi:hypothetical protein